jgi:hypothetical protein
MAWPESQESHTPPNSGTDGTTRLEGHIYGNSGKTQPNHSGVAQLLPCGQLDQEVSGPGPLCAATGGTVGTGTPEASGNRRTTPGSAQHQWTRILLSARKMRHATLKASGRRLSESRMRENRTYGLRWRGLETWPWWNCEPTPQSKERDWKPSTYSRRASPRPYQATAYSVRCAPASRRA